MVWVHIPAASAPLNRHITDGHTLLHRHVIKHATAVFISITNSSVCTQQTNNVQRNILCIHSGTKFAVHIDSAHVEFFHRYRLSRQNVPHLRSSNTKSNRSKRTMSRSMGITTHNGCSRLSDSLLRSHNMHNPLLTRCQIKVFNSKLLHIFAKLIDHRIRQRISKWLLLVVSGNNVIHRRKCPMWKFHTQTEVTEHSKCLRACYLMNQMCADKKLGAAIRQSSYCVFIPNFLI